LQAANKHMAASAAQRSTRRLVVRPVLLGSRQIQQAVKIVRHHGLVPPDVLERAGFRPEARR
jgi:hypothetical protein